MAQKTISVPAKFGSSQSFLENLFCKKIFLQAIILACLAAK